MNNSEMKPLEALKIKTAIFVICIYSLSAAAIYSSAVSRQNTAYVKDFKNSIELLEKSVAKQKAIADAAVKMSELAKKSGYELAVNDVIKDHAESMNALKMNLENLVKFENSNNPSNSYRTVLKVIIINMLVMLACLFFILGRLSRVIGYMSGQIDSVIRGGSAELKSPKFAGQLRPFYEKFCGLLNYAEGKHGGKADKNKPKPAKKK